jgi:hypothetical protein
MTEEITLLQALSFLTLDLVQQKERLRMRLLLIVILNTMMRTIPKR